MATLANGRTTPADQPPNFVLIVCDNLGYGDVGCFGSKKHRTPHLDRMARQGMRLTSFYATSGVCTPSRASIMTGCYPRRVNMHVGEGGRCVLFPVARKGLHPDEVTIAEVLKARGYATACVGKWHLGDQPLFLPTRQGFDHYFGIPYSDDMTERKDRGWPPLPLMRGERVVEAPPDRNTLTRRYTEETIRLIEANRYRPFFIYLAHAMPGSTRAPFASAAFKGKSHRPDTRGPRAPGPGRADADRLDLGQWCATPQPAPGQQRAAARLGLHHRRGRHAGAVHRLVAGDGARREGLRPGVHDDGLVAHFRTPRRRAIATPTD